MALSSLGGVWPVAYCAAGGLLWSLPGLAGRCLRNTWDKGEAALGEALD